MSQKTEKELSVAVRVMCHNEESTIEEVLLRLLAAADEQPYRASVEVINDGSSDDSPTIVRKVARQDDRVRLYSHPVNLGIGAVLRHAFRPTSEDVVVLLCGDLQFAPEDVFVLVAHLEGNALAIATRTNRQDSWSRRAITRTDELLSKLLVGRSFPDVHWVRAVRGEYLSDCELVCRSPMVDLELANHVVRRGGRVVTVPLPHYSRSSGRAAGASPKRLAKSFVDLVRIALVERRRR